MAVKFLVGTAARYQELKDNHQILAENFYRITDSPTGNDMYIGERKLTSQEDVDKALAYIGTLTDLQTSVKTDLVAALNSLKTDLTISIDAPDSETEGAAKTYIVKQGGTEVGRINIPADMVVKSGKVVINPAGQTAGTYIELTLANATNDKIYVNVGDLVDVYTVAQNAPQIQLAINGREISASIKAASITNTELANDAVATANIIDGNVTLDKLADAIKTSLGKADSALQKASIAEGTENGTIAVGGTDVPVHGLGTAAYANTDAFDAKGDAAAVLGTAADTATANTVYGAKKAAADVLGTSTDNKDANTVYGAKAYADAKVAAAALVWETM